MVYKYNLPNLPYEYDALEPVISKNTLEFHHDKHHQTYCDKFNSALETEGIDNSNILEIFSNVSSYSPAIRNHGGGYFNHIFYWESLASPDSTKCEGAILEKINESFGSYDKFKEEFTTKAVALFGSGWTWLGLKEDGSLTIHNTANQDNTYMDVVEEKYTPLLVIDVWEHAYYLDYQNKRPAHIEEFFKIINWDKVNQRLNE